MGEWTRATAGLPCSCINVYGHGMSPYPDRYLYNRSHPTMISARRMATFLDTVAIAAAPLFMSRRFCLYTGALRVERVRICVLSPLKLHVFPSQCLKKKKGLGGGSGKGGLFSFWGKKGGVLFSYHICMFRTMVVSFIFVFPSVFGSLNALA